MTEYNNESETKRNKLLGVSCVAANAAGELVAGRASMCVRVCSNLTTIMASPSLDVSSVFSCDPASSKLSWWMTWPQSMLGTPAEAPPPEDTPSCTEWKTKSRNNDNK